MFGQLRLSFQMTAAAFRMTMRFPASLLVALGNLVFLTLVAVGPALFMIWLWGQDGQAGYDFAKYFYQFWIVDNTIPRTAGGDIDFSNWEFGSTASAFAMWALVLYFLWATIVAFGSLVAATVIMHTGVQQLKGEAPSIGDGFALAGRNVGRLAGLAVIAGALVTLVKRALMVLRVVPFVGKWIRRAVMAAITATLYIVLPIVVYERSGPWSAFRNTWTHVRKTWGGLAVGTGLMLISVWVGLAIVNVFFTIYVTQPLFGDGDLAWSTMLITQVVAGVLLYCLNVTLAANLRAALYLHVTEGHTGVIPEAAFERSGTPTPAATPTAASGGFQLRP